MNALFYGNREMEIPGQWNELDRAQLLTVARAFRMGATEVKGRLAIFQALARIPWWRLKKFATYVMVEGAFDATQFIAEKNDLTKQLIPKFRRWFRTWYGPCDSIGNMRMAEFSFAEFYFMKYSQGKDEADLDRLIACLYRPKKWFYSTRRNAAGDPRVPFNPNLVERGAQAVAKWPGEVKTAVLFFYEGCRNEKVAAFPKVFSGDGDGESLYGLWSVMRGVAKAGHFGDFDKVQEQYVDTIMMELSETIAESERMEAEMKNAQQK